MPLKPLPQLGKGFNGGKLFLFTFILLFFCNYAL